MGGGGNSPPGWVQSDMAAAAAISVTSNPFKTLAVIKKSSLPLFTFHSLTHYSSLSHIKVGSYVGTYLRSYVGTYLRSRYLSTQLCRYLSFQLCRYLSTQLYRYLSTQLYWYISTQVALQVHLFVKVYILHIISPFFLSFSLSFSFFLLLSQHNLSFSYSLYVFIQSFPFLFYLSLIVLSLFSDIFLPSRSISFTLCLYQIILFLSFFLSLSLVFLTPFQRYLFSYFFVYPPVTPYSIVCQPPSFSLLTTRRWQPSLTSHKKSIWPFSLIFHSQASSKIYKKYPKTSGKSGHQKIRKMFFQLKSCLE